jgi:hypothetical protein
VDDLLRVGDGERRGDLLAQPQPPLEGSRRNSTVSHSKRRLTGPERITAPASEQPLLQREQSLLVHQQSLL